MSKMILKRTFPNLAKVYWMAKHFSKIRMEYLQLSMMGEKPLNGQMERTALCERILDEFQPEIIVETGTFLGNTTRFFHDASRNFGAKVYTCETNDLFFPIAKHRFEKDGMDVRAINMSSDVFLRDHFQIDPATRLFVYLDAHWEDHLPLREEIRSLARFKNVVVFIDDFKVERAGGSNGFGYDDYGDVGTLTLDWIRDDLDDFQVYFPTYSADEDGGARTGLVVLSKGDLATRVVAQESKLARYPG